VSQLLVDHSLDTSGDFSSEFLRDERESRIRARESRIGDAAEKTSIDVSHARVPLF
jgi:hypothetical protein